MIDSFVQLSKHSSSWLWLSYGSVIFSVSIATQFQSCCAEQFCQSFLTLLFSRFFNNQSWWPNESCPCGGFLRVLAAELCAWLPEVTAQLWDCVTGAVFSIPMPNLDCLFVQKVWDGACRWQELTVTRLPPTQPVLSLPQLQLTRTEKPLPGFPLLPEHTTH